MRRSSESAINPLLTDLYELTMAYAYWSAGHHERHAVFDAFFRSNPFGGEFTVFAGLRDVVDFVRDYRFTPEQLDYVRSVMPGCADEFYEWLARLDCRDVRVSALREGSLAFPRIPLITVEGPLAICQLLETTILNLINYATLETTNAARFRLAVGPNKTLVEFGLRRAQGPDGGMSASRYSYMGGFDATSNVLAGWLYGIPVRGTHAHSFVSAFAGMGDLHSRILASTAGEDVDFVALVESCRERLGFTSTNEGELASFVAYAQAFPRSFLALVDTYDTLQSGVPNFLIVAAALHRLGYSPVGVRLDSGDLAFLSRRTRQMFRQVSRDHGLPFDGLSITASNNLNEATINALNQQGHEIDVFGVGTHLVTCEAQPALGCVYKLVEVDGSPRIKLSQDIGKVTIPGRKQGYRLLGADGHPVLDILLQAGEAPPQPGQRILCRHPFDETKRAYVTPSAVIPLYHEVWNGEAAPLPSLKETRDYVVEQISSMRPDHVRPLNPTPYKISVSDKLYSFVHVLWMQEAPIAELL